jgi:peptidoglycan/LPS O-acetylase OafA/YrhL
MFSGAVVFAGLSVYSRMASTGSAFNWQLIMCAGFVLSGIAESLPNNRRRAAGAFRIAAVLLLAGLLATTILVPEVVLGEP